MSSQLDPNRVFLQTLPDSTPIRWPSTVPLPG